MGRFGIVGQPDIEVVSSSVLASPGGSSSSPFQTSPTTGDDKSVEEKHRHYRRTSDREPKTSSSRNVENRFVQIRSFGSV
mmetsp:Transcript_11822/g.16374  ORF Transcript_11822/g.16374 Transcript_11822/m.16374 type:complete len:80 (-) Transcript_11822:335-574(-)